MDAHAREGNQTPQIDKPQNAAERKAALIRQGELYRLGVVHAKAQVKHAARPDQLFHSALNYTTWAMRSRIDGLLKPGGTSVSALMPFAMAVIGFIRRRKGGKASLGVALALAGIGWYLQQRRQATPQ